MKLIDALEFGQECGLTTVREALDNIEIHASSLFIYKTMDGELKELMDEAKGIDESKSIKETLMKLMYGSTQ